MNQRWSLKELYESFKIEAFIEDMELCSEKIEKIKRWAMESLNGATEANSVAHGKSVIEQYITLENEFGHIFEKLMSFSELTSSVDAKNEEAIANIEKLELMATELTVPRVSFMKWIGGLSNLSELIDSSDLLKAHKYYLLEIAENYKYLLSEKEEVVIAKMKNTGSNAWTKLQELASSTLLVDITIAGEEKHLPLPVVRNMAYEKDAFTRKNAYEAELNSYKRIEQSSAAALNGIKGEVITIASMRGYDSPLQKTVLDARMDMETLDVMLAAMKESLPIFHKYYRKKAELLGYKNGLPFYDMFAPMGEVNMTYTYEQAREYIVNNFRKFSHKLADFADNAFENNWIDAEPREGKRGGAFCSNLHSIKASRVMTNFTGSFSDVITIAHELGHAYHGSCLEEESYLNSNYPMPIAETASIFCETIIKNAALKEASKEEAFAILESSISDSGQVIVDIYSRFLFESALFEKRKESSVSANELKELMLKAQKDAYGDGLDHNALHPYMWICKPHYYYGDFNFYNFPYAFGLLFAKGLYAEYTNRGDAFVEEYDRLLSITGKSKVPDITKVMGIDIHSIDFWRNSLKVIEKEIEEFVKL